MANQKQIEPQLSKEKNSLQVAQEETQQEKDDCQQVQAQLEQLADDNPEIGITLY